MPTLTRCYKYRLYPNHDQETTLVQWAGCRRYIWNWALQRKQNYYRATGQRLSYAALAADLTQLKHEPTYVWLRECVAQTLQQALMDLEQAFINFFAKRAKYPRFKRRRRTLHSLRFPQGVTVIGDHSIRAPKLGVVRAIIHRPLLGITKSATIKQDATGSWWVVFVCHIDRPEMASSADHSVGVDVGLESFITLHTGEKTAPPKFYRQGEHTLKRLQQRLSRTQMGSMNRQKVKRRLAKAHQRIRNQRTDWLHKQALGLIRDFDTVCIEDLNVKGLARTKLAKSFSDAALGTFMQMLDHKAAWHGRQLVRVGRFFASSKTCHHCDTKTALSLADRTWTCHACGTTHDRDVNAAINILHEGLRLVAAGMTETQNAAGDCVRPAKRGRLGH